MNKKFVIFGAAFAFLFSLVATTGLCFAKNTGPANMILKTARAKKPAHFSHKKHQDMFKCATCHHTKGPDGKQQAYTEGMKIQKCETCHDSMKGKLKGLKGAAHTRCKGCHKKMKKEGKNAPTKCSGCHIKKKKKRIEGC